MLRQPFDNLHLFLHAQTIDRDLDHAPHARLVHRDKALIIHEGEKAHDELAVHAVRHAAVPGDRVPKVLDLEGALQAGSEEAAEGGDEGGECREDEDVEVDGGEGDGGGEDGGVVGEGG